MVITGRGMTTDRLMELERTVDVLNGRLCDMRWELQQAKGQSLSERFWKNLMEAWQGSEFMSAVCNRRIRPNTKAVDHASSIGH